MEEEKKKNLSLKEIFQGVLGLLILLSIFAVPIMFLWNGLLPDLTNGQAPTIEYRQAWGLALMTFFFGRCFSPAN